MDTRELQKASINIFEYLSKDEKIIFIKRVISNNNNSIDLPNLSHKDTFGVNRTMLRAYRGIIDGKATKYYFVESDYATSCIDIVSDDTIEILFNFLCEKFAD